MHCKPLKRGKVHEHLDAQLRYTEKKPCCGVAFFEAMRRANAELLADLAARLDRVDGEASALLARMVREGRAWADLALQTHYGMYPPTLQP
jgi:hypothetical protein